LSERRDEFVNRLSHDLRLPLAVIKESINLILDGVPGETNEKQKKILAVAKNNVDKMAAMIDTFVDKAKEKEESDG
jgi:signal transduction histidine kinase